MEAPSVLFICVSNTGKSQMAAALMAHHANGAVRALSAGTHPGTHLNAEMVEVLKEWGIDISDAHPREIDPELMRHADRVIVLGTQADVAPAACMRAPIERWATDEPSEYGITGMERMRLIRAEIDTRVRALLRDVNA
ncbi:MAG: low molecular weight phosphatase family protein [Bowdeniella nasicola]|nr:low molecular weight phosphatase family protein [Bowdeniella nasicola]